MFCCFSIHVYPVLVNCLHVQIFNRGLNTWVCVLPRLFITCVLPPEWNIPENKVLVLFTIASPGCYTEPWNIRVLMNIRLIKESIILLLQTPIRLESFGLFAPWGGSFCTIVSGTVAPARVKGRQKQSAHPSADQGTSGCGRSVWWDYCSAVKRKYWFSSNMDEPWKHYAKWREPDTKDHMLSAPIYIKCPELATLYRQRRPVASRGLREGVREWGFFLRGWNCSWLGWRWRTHSPVMTLETTELCALKGWVLWRVNYISIKLFEKEKPRGRSCLIRACKVLFPREPCSGALHGVS